MRALVALIAGTLFGAGLAISGMADPMRVRSFFDLFGAWDPTLGFVMGGAMIPMAIAWVIQKRTPKPFVDQNFDLPTTSQIDRKLALGAILFGSGWGIAGLCPGPALADLAINPSPALVFVMAMFGGIAVHRFTV
jgi:uncharacterized membrane protein YedE/YeeE